LSGFYRSFLRPIFHLTLQIEAVKDGRLENISVYKGKDELGRLSDFTHKTLEEIQKVIRRFQRGTDAVCHIEISNVPEDMGH
jgi:methyl-accepting chemotaxis protein